MSHMYNTKPGFFFLFLKTNKYYDPYTRKCEVSHITVDAQCGFQALSRQLLYTPTRKNKKQGKTTGAFKVKPLNVFQRLKDE